MSNQIVFGSTNPNKLREIRLLLPKEIDLVSMQEMGIKSSLPETSPTIAGNAIQKVDTLFTFCGKNCFAEDTGLEVKALHGQPGVRTARFAGDDPSDRENMALLLDKLQNHKDRSAQFRTVVALIWEGNTYSFEGIVKGEIAEDVRGEGGFGYDPVFMPEGYQKTFGELPDHIKNSISHRSRAIHKLVSFLREKIEDQN